MEVNTQSIVIAKAQAGQPRFLKLTQDWTPYCLNIQNLWDVYGTQGKPHNINAQLEAFSEAPQTMLTRILYIPAKHKPAG